MTIRSASARLLAATALLAAHSGCKTAPPPDVVCPTTAGDPIDFCTINQAPLLVKATVQQWTSGGTRVLDLTGFTDTAFTPVALVVAQSPRGSASGRLDVLMRGCIDATGTSIDGPLKTESGLSTGWFFITPEDGYDVVEPQGFYWFGGDLLHNSGIDATVGISESELMDRIAGEAAVPGCNPPDASLW